MTELLIVQVTLAALSGLWLWWILRRPRAPETGADRATAYRVREAELKADLAAGLIAQDQWQALEEDLQQQLLGEYQDSEDLPIHARTVAKPWLIALLLPVAALLIYVKNGAIADIWVAQSQQAFMTEPSPESHAAFEQALRTGLRLQPDRVPFMMPLAELAMQRGDFTTAEQYYRRMVDMLPEHPSLTAKWVQADYLNNERQLSPGMRIKLQRVLTEEPGQTTALGLLGIDAFDKGDDRAAMSYWKRLLAVLPPDSPRAELISGAMAQSRERLGMAAEAPLAAEGNDFQRQLTVRLDIAPGLSTRGGRALFVIAKAPGTRIPVAVRKLPVPDGPLTITLGDEHSMRPGHLLFDQEAIEVTARISMSGQPAAGKGDLKGQSGVLKALEAGTEIALTIDSVVDQ